MYLLIVILVVLSIASGKIDGKGGLLGGFITGLLFASLGDAGVWLIGLFFGLGTLASLYKLQIKRQWGVSEGREGKRGWKNVVSNSGVAGMVALADVGIPYLIKEDGLLIAACFASALSDTLSSEMGNATGKRYYHILTGKPSPRGPDGVVSLAGLGWGVVGSAVIATVYGVFEGTYSGIGIVLLSGMVGNLVDSVLGATLQARGTLSNHGVNLLSTVVATGLAFLFTFW